MTQRLPTGTRALVATLTLASALCPSRATASGYLTARFGADEGSPVAANPFAIYFNPGALGMAPKGTQIVGDLTTVFRSASYERSAQALTPSSERLASDPNYVRANTGKASLFNVLPLPFVAAASDLGVKNLHVGYALYVPFGGSASWNKAKAWDGSTYAPGAVDGPQRWSNISGSITTVFNTVAAAYHFEKARLSIGVNASLIYQTVKTVRARNLDGSDDVRGLNGALKEGRSLLDVSGLTYAFAVGVLWDPTDDGSVKIGLSYTTQPGFGETRMKGQLTNQTGSDRAVAPAADVDFLQAWPDIVRAGLAYRPTPNSEIRLDGEYARWSLLQRQCVVLRGTACDLHAEGGLQGAGAGNVLLNIPRNWNDSMGLRFGGAYGPTARSEVFGSVAVTTSAVPKSRIDPSTIDADQIFFTLGGRYQVTPRAGVAVSYTQVYMAPVDTAGTSEYASFASTSRSPRMDGVYRVTIGLLNVNATYTF